MTQTPQGFLYSRLRGEASRSAPDDQTLEQAAAQLRPSWADAPPRARSATGAAVPDALRMPDQAARSPANPSPAFGRGGARVGAPAYEARAAHGDDDFDE